MKKEGPDHLSRREFLERTLFGLGGAMLFPGFRKSWTSEEQKYYQFWENLKKLPEDKKLGIALVGLGSYATYQLAPALQQTKLCRLTGIVTGTPAKAERWAKEYNIPAKNIYNYENYDTIADNPDIDIIYVVLPNSMHAEYTIRAAKAGKHVISEKPMATSVADARDMVDACRNAGKKLSIGYRLHFEPHNEEMMHLGGDEVMGPVKSIEGAHSFRIRGNPNIWRLNKKLAGGGPLMDIGIYVVQGSIYTMGKLPIAVTAREETHNKELFSQVEETISWNLEFPGGVIAKGESSYAGRGNYLRADAKDGWFRLQPAYSYRGIRGETSRGVMSFPQVAQQTMQMDDFAYCIMNDKESRVPGEMGLRDMKILMAIYEAAERGGKVKLDL